VTNQSDHSGEQGQYGPPQGSPSGQGQYGPPPYGSPAGQQGQYGPPQGSPSGQGQYGPPPYGSPAPGGESAQYGYQNPVSGVLGEAWKLYRAHAAHFLVIAFVIYFIAAILEAILRAFAGVAGAVPAGVIGLIAAFLLQAALIKAVQDVRDGRVDLDFGQTVSAAVPYLLPVAVASILASIGIAIGLVLVIVPGLVLLTFWSLIVPSIVIGGSGALDSFGQSWRTVRGYAWHVFGTYALVFLILIAFDVVLGLILAALPTLARSFISGIVSGTLVAPFLALVVTLLYYRLTAAHGGGQAEEAVNPGTAPPTATT
jgi:hypothetical protein